MDSRHARGNSQSKAQIRLDKALKIERGKINEGKN
jgi:hypothetical protein